LFQGARGVPSHSGSKKKRVEDRIDGGNASIAPKRKKGKEGRAIYYVSLTREERS